MTLHLSLKELWFRMIQKGIKYEEYRDINPHYVSLLLEPDKNLTRKGFHELFGKNGCYTVYSKQEYVDLVKDFIEVGLLTWKPIDKACLSLGYPKRGDLSRHLNKNVHKIRIGKPNPEWCPQEAVDQECFVIELLMRKE